MAERVDLDAVQRYFEHWLDPQFANHVEVVLARRGLAVLAELRAAREVVDAEREFGTHEPDATSGCTTCRALAAYDQATTP
jgi:hypothetical protein